VYSLGVKKAQRSRSHPVKSIPTRRLQRLKKCLRELRTIHCEAVKILNKLLTGPPAEIVRSLCKCFYILQEYFVMRYQEARAYAISVLGYVDAASCCLLKETLAGPM
jgi:hypothetical protein